MSGLCQVSGASALTPTASPSPESLIDVNSGVERARLEIHCGDQQGIVTLRTGVIYGTRLAHRYNGFTITYSGTHCDGCHWIQFGWVSASITRNGVAAVKTGAIPSMSGLEQLTTDPRDPKWFVDATDTRTPTYDARGASIRNGTSITEFDAPRFVSDFAFPEVYLPTVSKLLITAQFQSFLVCKRSTGSGRICARAALMITWLVQVAHPLTNSRETEEFTDTSIVTRPRAALTAGQMEALNHQYPHQDWIR